MKKCPGNCEKECARWSYESTCISEDHGGYPFHCLIVAIIDQFLVAKVVLPKEALVAAASWAISVLQRSFDQILSDEFPLTEQKQKYDG